ncbi:MAG: Hsp20 family protein [Alphaproteobacteria bacterium]|nr:Hsp20 family protein [Alphaproteobacteria bacterium]
MAFLTSNNPFMLGFDSLERMLDRAAKNSENYPPYNIEQIDPCHLQITIAVAGFSEDDLTIEEEDKQLIVRGQHAEDENAPERQYLYRGIAARQFQRSFILADGVEVIDAHLNNGLLHIDLEQKEPEVKVRQIKISKKGEKSSEKAKIEKKS